MKGALLLAFLVTALLLGTLVLGGCLGADATGGEGPFALVEAEVASGPDTDMVIGAHHPETDERLGEIRWEAVEYRILLRHDGDEALEDVEVRLLPSEEIRELYGEDPFARRAGVRSNYGELFYSVELGRELEVKRSITTDAHETEYAHNVESPLTPAEHERLLEIAHQVTLEVRWDGGSQRFGPEDLAITPLPTASPEGTPGESAAGPAVEVVYVVPGLPLPSRHDPLWGDLAEDRESLDEFLTALDVARPVEGPTDEVPHARAEWLVIRYSDGSDTRVRRAYDCTRSTDEEGRMGETCRPVSDRWFIAGRGVVESAALTRRWNRMGEYMPPVERVQVPEVAQQGERFTVSGRGWVESDRVRLIVNVMQGNDIFLAEVPLDHGAFRWEGVLPTQVPTGRHNLLVKTPQGTGVGPPLTVIESEERR